MSVVAMSSNPVMKMPCPPPDSNCAGSIELAEMTDVVSELFELSGHKRDEGIVSSVPVKCNTKTHKLYPNPLLEPT